MMDIRGMLPHRKPMLMISAVLSYGEQQLVAESLIDSDNPLLQDGMFPGYGCLELLAQASGLFLGAQKQGEAAKPGAIVSVRHMQTHQTRLPIDKALMVTTNLLGSSGGTAMFQGEVSQAGEMVMQASLTVSQFPEGVIG